MCMLCEIIILIVQIYGICACKINSKSDIMIFRFKFQRLKHKLSFEIIFVDGYLIMLTLKFSTPVFYLPSNENNNDNNNKNFYSDGV